MFNKQFDPALPNPQITDIASAKAALQDALQRYKQNLRAASPEKLAETVEMGGMQATVGALSCVAVVDTVNHHGQITYIQTLLGDDESHFTPDFFGHFK